MMQRKTVDIGAHAPLKITDRTWLWPTLKVKCNNSVLPTNSSLFNIGDLGVCYIPFCDDFGPMNLATVYRFCNALDAICRNSTISNVIVISAPSKQDTTNAAFLLGAHMIMHRGLNPDQVYQCFYCVQPWLISYRDVSPGKQNFCLHLIDCWEGLWRAKQLSWLSFEAGRFELADYEHCDSPLNADLHEVVPGKFVAMRGPRRLAGGQAFENTPGGTRDFSPAYYADILLQYDVQVVVRLNEPHYDVADWASEGLALADLPFDDCATPPPAIVAAFLAIAEGVPGAVAVHCHAGLGRTGTLIALYMMKHHGFTARQAMGWLRIVRPGSVIGPQQQFLCDSEGTIRAAGEGFRRRGGAAVRLAAGVTAGELSEFIASAIAAANARASALQLDDVDAGRDDAVWVELAEHVLEARTRRDRRRCAPAGMRGRCSPPSPSND